MQQRSVIIAILFLICGILSPGCAGDDPNGNGHSAPDYADMVDMLIDEILAAWLGVEHSPYGNGYTDTNFSGNVDTHDAVNLIESLNAIGFAIPKTTITGLHGNYYTEGGYDLRIEDLYDIVAFSYTLSSSITEAQLEAGEFWRLSPGDLVFIDYNEDGYWNNAILYIGEYGEYANAGVTAYDYYETTFVADLDTDTVINLDIEYGNSEVRHLDYGHIRKHYQH